MPLQFLCFGLSLSEDGAYLFNLLLFAAQVYA